MRAVPSAEEDPEPGRRCLNSLRRQSGMRTKAGQLVFLPLGGLPLSPSRGTHSPSANGLVARQAISCERAERE